jgi:hypothetical protein
MKRPDPKPDAEVPGLLVEGNLSPGTSRQPAFAWVASKAPTTLAATTSVITLNAIFIDVLPTVSQSFTDCAKCAFLDNESLGQELDTSKLIKAVS